MKSVILTYNGYMDAMVSCCSLHFYLMLTSFSVLQFDFTFCYAKF